MHRAGTVGLSGDPSRAGTRGVPTASHDPATSEAIWLRPVLTVRSWDAALGNDVPGHTRGSLLPLVLGDVLPLSLGHGGHGASILPPSHWECVNAQHCALMAGRRGRQQSSHW